MWGLIVSRSGSPQVVFQDVGVARGLTGSGIGSDIPSHKSAAEHVLLCIPMAANLISMSTL